MIDVDWRPERGKLRQFGWIALIGFGLFGALLAHGIGTFEGRAPWTWPVVLWILAALCPVLGYLFPPALRVTYVALMAIALPIGLVISTILLGFVFFLMFTPLALLFKLRGRDELSRSWDEDAGSYWIAVTAKREPSSYYRQF